MAQQPLGLDPNRLAAVLYGPEDDVDTIVSDFASDLLCAGERIGGVVQHNINDEHGKQVGMQVIDLMTGRQISICQPLGHGASACKLDLAGLAEASLAVARAVEDEVALIIVNKFSKQEAAGHGLRNELASAVVAGLTVLTAVPDKCVDAWRVFTGDRGTTLLCERRTIDAWWGEVSSREARGSSQQPPHRGTLRPRLASTCRS